MYIAHLTTILSRFTLYFTPCTTLLDLFPLAYIKATYCNDIYPIQYTLLYCIVSFSLSLFLTLSLIYFYHGIRATNLVVLNPRPI